MSNITKIPRGEISLALIICCTVFLMKLDLFIVNISLPTIASYLKADTSQISFILLAYQLFLTAPLLTVAYLSDCTGFKKIFLTGTFVFTVFSFLCAFSTDLPVLIAMRCFQGLGTSMMIVTIFMIVTRCISPMRKGHVLGLASMASSLGLILGNSAGGMISGFLSWRWIFLINVPFGIFLFFFACLILKNQNDATVKPERKKFDYVGSIFSFLSVTFLILALNQGQEMGWDSKIIITSFSLSLISLIVFILRQKSATSPLLDLGLFKNTDYSLAIATSVFSFMAFGGINFLLPFYMELFLGLKPQQSGLLFLVYPVVYIFIAPWAGSLSDKYNPRVLCLGGMSVLMFSMMIFFMTANIKNLVPVIIFLMLNAVAYSFFISPNNKLIISIIPKDKEGMAIGTYNMSTNLGMLLGVSIFETVFSENIPIGINLTALCSLPENIFAATLRTCVENTLVLGLMTATLSFLLVLISVIHKRKFPL